jgi:hypothetical protein
VKPVLNGTWTEWNPVFRGKFLVLKILCKAHYVTRFNEWNLTWKWKDRALI